jgi:hypothetical protein
MVVVQAARYRYENSNMEDGATIDQSNSCEVVLNLLLTEFLYGWTLRH